MTDTTDLDVPGLTSSSGGATAAGTRRPSRSLTTVTPSPSWVTTLVSPTGQSRTLGELDGERMDTFATLSRMEQESAAST